MSLQYHPAVIHDVAEAIQHYQSVSHVLSSEFKVELRRVIAMAVSNRGRFRLIKSEYHRANLKRFPYHIVYRTIPGGIRMMIVRHHRRHPDSGMEQD